MRSLALGIIAEFPPSPGSSTSALTGDPATARRIELEEEGRVGGGTGRGAGTEGGRRRGEGVGAGWEEIVGACVRAAGDGYHESPAVVTEALRFLCRCDVIMRTTVVRFVAG